MTLPRPCQILLTKAHAHAAMVERGMTAPNPDKLLLLIARLYVWFRFGDVVVNPFFEPPPDGALRHLQSLWCIVFFERDGEWFRHEMMPDPRHVLLGGDPV